MSDSVTRVILNTRLDPGVQLNDTYEIDERIASGGMGEVYRGHNIQTGDPVAIKAILPELADQEAIFALFKKEATVLGRLHHDTIVRYYSFSRDPRLGRPYLAMEFVNGVSLADHMIASPLLPTRRESCSPASRTDWRSRTAPGSSTAIFRRTTSSCATAMSPGPRLSISASRVPPMSVKAR